MTRIRYKWGLLAIVAMIAGAAFIWTRSYIFSNVGVSLQKRIQSLDLSGFNVRYDSISVDWIGNVIEIRNVVLEKNAYDTTCVYPESITIGNVRAEGLGLFSLVFKNVLTLDAVRLKELKVLVRENSLLELDSATRRENEFSLVVDDLFVESMQFTYLDSAECEIITDFKSHLAISNLGLDFRLDRPLEYRASSVSLDSVTIDAPRQSYVFSVLKAQFDVSNEGFSIDSIRVTPQLPKVAFGRKFGYEIDRFEAVIPYVRGRNVAMSLSDSSVIKADVAEVQFFLKVFRDKRLPFLKKLKSMPIAMLQDLPFGLVVDSLKVTNSYVLYEEFAEGTTEPGSVFFDNLYAVLLNINNRAATGETKLSAHAKLLGRGNLDLFATFPLQKNRRASLKGSVKEFDLPEINSMLTPATQLKVESGNMKELAFTFTFNSKRSDGEIELNYDNLKIVSFKDEAKTKGDEPEKDNLKTFIMNTFIFRKKMDEDVPVDKRTGTVGYERDEYRSIFNFWVKSLVSGIKSAYNLDKMEAKKSDKEIRKEQRQEKREARRAKRAEKKKERG